MSKLLDALDKIKRGAPEPMGFRAVKRTDKIPQLAIVGLVGSRALKRLGEARDSLDAVLLEPGVATDPAGSLPWGRLAGGPEAAADEEGADFIALPSPSVAVGILPGEDKTTRLLYVKPDMEERWLRTLDGLPVEGYILDAPPIETSFTLEDLMRVALVRGSVGKPLFVPVTPGLNQQELVALRDMDVDALVVTLADVTAEQVATLRATLTDLPKRKDDRRDHSMVVLPRAAYGPGPERPPRREDDDDDGEDDE